MTTTTDATTEAATAERIATRELGVDVGRLFAGLPDDADLTHLDRRLAEGRAALARATAETPADTARVKEAGYAVAEGHLLLLRRLTELAAERPPGRVFTIAVAAARMAARDAYGTAPAQTGWKIDLRNGGESTLLARHRATAVDIFDVRSCARAARRFAARAVRSAGGRR
jgi:hypothetical protein